MRGARFFTLHRADSLFIIHWLGIPSDRVFFGGEGQSPIIRSGMVYHTILEISLQEHSPVEQLPRWMHL